MKYPFKNCHSKDTKGTGRTRCRWQ